MRLRSSKLKRNENGGMRAPVCSIGRFIASAPVGQPRYALILRSNQLILQIMRSTFLCRGAPLISINSCAYSGISAVGCSLAHLETVSAPFDTPDVRTNPVQLFRCLISSLKVKTAEGAATHFDGIEVQSVYKSYIFSALFSSLNGAAV
jgi:hypothetical protein